MILKGRIFLLLILTVQALAAQDSSLLIRRLPKSSLDKIQLLTLKRAPAVLSLKETELTAIVFLSPECPLCQNYSLTLNRLAEKWKEAVNIIGIIPGKAYTQKEIRSFQREYKIVFPILIDSRKQLSALTAASVTPEVILADRAGFIRYRGAIDNWAVSLGKQRLRPSSGYLEDAITQALSGQTVALQKTKPIGCLINDY